MDTRIEIYKDGLWQELQLENDAAIKYNAVINRVGKVASREISHTNTFSLPYVHTNIQVLGLNEFNPTLMAKAMNAKYEARYYVEEKLLQEGFIVINNTNNGKINVNFIDDALGLVERWGEMSYEQLLNSTELSFPADYVTAIDELLDAYIPPTAVIADQPEVGTRGYPVVSFPNNLNQIGDKFNKDEDDIRHDNHVNLFQSRPAFNVKAFMDLATYSFDYTPVYDSSVDWDLLAETYMTIDGGDKNKEADNSTETIFNATTMSVSAHYKAYSEFGPEEADPRPFYFRSQTFFLVGQNPMQETWPINAPGYYWPGYMDFNQTGGANAWNQRSILYRPDFTNGYTGNIRWTADVPGPAHDRRVEITVWWRSSTSGAAGIPVRLDPIGGTAVPEITFGTEHDFDMTMEKSYFSTIPSGAIYMMGITVDYHRHQQLSNLESRLKNMRIEETILQGDVVAFDEDNQFAPTNVNLSYAASKKPIKEILSSIMHKEGILMNINNRTKEVKFFNYNHYATQRDNSNYSNWTNMMLEYNPIKYNTDYGNEFGTLNHISLSDPFQGNIYPIILINQGELSKYKEFAQNEVKQFKDVSDVVFVDNSVKDDWYEYEIKGFGLVEENGVIPSIFCMTANGNTQGSKTNLQKLANVNYGRIPAGVESWYQLVDNAIRVEAEFLLAIETIRELDLSEPIYVEQLGGFYIIEEIKEYKNSSTPTKVKLIKLIDQIQPKSVQNNDPKLITIGGSKTPSGGGTKYEIGGYVSLYDYSITTGSITASQYTAHPDDGGTLTGLTFSETIGNSSSQLTADFTTAEPDDTFVAVFSETSVTTAQEGWYEVVTTLSGTATGFAATSTPTITSETSIVYLGDVAAPVKEFKVAINDKASLLLELGKASFDYKLINFDNTTNVIVTCEYQKLDGPNGSAIGSLVTDTSIPNLIEESGVVEVLFPEDNEFYRVIFKTTEADSVSNAFDGFYVI